MVEPACDVRVIEGPSLLGEDAVIALRFAEGSGAAIDPAAIARWREISRRAGLPGPELPARNVTPAVLAAVTLGFLTAAIAGRSAGSVRSRRPGDGSEELHVPGLPAALARRAVETALAIVRLAGLPSAPATGADAIADAVTDLRREHAAAVAAPDDHVFAALVAASTAAGIPWRWSRLHPGTLLVGEGRAQARFDGTGSMWNPVLGALVSRDKVLAKRFLRGLGLPVAPHRVVASPEEAAAAGDALGFPIVVKPVDGSLARGVSLDVRDGAEAIEAYARAAPHGSAVMVEPYLDVPDYRAIVVDGEIVVVYRRAPPYVVGDGVTPIRALIAAHNAALATPAARFQALVATEIDADVERTLALAGRSLDTVPADGERIVLRSVPFVTRGGFAEEVTGDVHPETARLLCRVARVLRLSLAAIDFRAAAIERPWHAQRFAILEANARPVAMTEHAGRIAAAMLAAHFPDPAAGRLPCTLVLDPRAGADMDALLRAAATMAPEAGLAGPAGLHVGGIRVLAPPISPRQALDRAAEDPTASQILLWLRPTDIEAHGLGLRRIDRAFLPLQPAPGLEAATCALVRCHARRVLPLPAGTAAARMAAVLAPLTLA
ncbi:MAG: hypothetical protein IT561_13270 [Alphaproteobacteria bacterium]|nr:hypothetical protein [Alphaproteobacteria bacterium]